MKVTTSYLNDLTTKIEGKIDQMLAKLRQQDKLIISLKAKNAELERNNEKTLDQIKEYIKELEQIRAYYVNNNNNSTK